MDKLNKLPPLQEDAFDGEKYKAEMGTKNRCQHMGFVEFVGNSRIQCRRCGNGWEGENIGKLLALFKTA